jgi:hypothetical protein
MNFINLLRTWVKGVKMSNNRIRKDDLDALGDMAGLVGTYMKDYAGKVEDGGDRRKLFKAGFDVRRTLAQALLPADDDAAQQLVPDNVSLAAMPDVTDTDRRMLEAMAKRPESAPQPESAPASIPAPPMVQRVPQAYAMEPTAPLPPPLPSNQMEFGFVERVVQGYGSVGDVIKHFNSRLDNVEESIRMIRDMLIAIRGNMPKKHNKTKNAP